MRGYVFRVVSKECTRRIPPIRTYAGSNCASENPHVIIYNAEEPIGEDCLEVTYLGFELSGAIVRIEMPRGEITP